MLSDRAKHNRYLSNQARKKRIYIQRMSFARWVLGEECVKCGATTRLQFDHIDPNNKLIELSRAYDVSLDRFLSEIPKCQLLCHACHLEKSKTDGTHPAYKTEGISDDDLEELIPSY